MAKGNIILGTLQGSVGDLNFKVRKGKQVLSKKIVNMKNPRSQRQMIQRMIFNTVQQAFSAMKAICDHSFEGVIPGADCQAEFTKRNLTFLRTQLQSDISGHITRSLANFNLKNNNNPVLNKLIIAKGTLPSVYSEDFNHKNEGTYDPAYSIVLFPATSSDKQIAMNNWLSQNGAQEGDYFTFCFLLKDTEISVGDQPVYRFVYARFIVKSIEVQGETLLTLETSLVSSQSDLPDAEDCFGTDFIQGLETANFSLNLFDLFTSLFYQEGRYEAHAYAIIHSRQASDGEWLRSNTSFNVRSDWRDLDVDFPSDYETALISYYPGGDPKGEAEYILNGGSK